MMLEKSDIIGHKNMLDQNPTPYMTTSKWITDLNVKYKTIKLWEDNIGGNLWDLGLAEVVDMMRKHTP